MESIVEVFKLLKSKVRKAWFTPREWRRIESAESQLAEGLEFDSELGTGNPEVTSLPDDFPAVEILRENGFVTIESVSEATDAELSEVKGIGPATLEDIRGAL